MTIENDNLSVSEDTLNKKIEFIFGIDELKPKDLVKVKSLLVDLYEEKYGTIPILNL